MSQSKEEQLKEIAAQISECQKCPLYKIATNPVPGEGSAEAELFFVGEAPGRHEDLQGRPFVGLAGRLLEEALASVGLSRDKVFITNVLHHRPPGNRDPAPREVEACRHFFLSQLEIIQPPIVVPLGRFALNTFLPEAKISQSRGKMLKGRVEGDDTIDFDFILFPMYHPAAGLRSGKILEEFRNDFEKLGKLLALERGELGKLAPEDNEAESKKSEQMGLGI